MDDGGDERRRRAARAHGLVHVRGIARAAGGDDRDVHGIGDGAGEREFIAVAGPVGVDGIDAEFARPQFLAAAWVPTMR